jgi:hypothetical protein
MTSREEERCHFCGGPRSAVGHLVNGPRVSICDRCVRACTELLPKGDTVGAAVQYRPTLQTRSNSSDDSVGTALAPHCTFCGKYPREVKATVEGYTTRICDECLGLCRDILEESTEAAVIELNARHPLVGTWRDPDGDGSTVRFIVRPTGSTFDARVVDKIDGEEIEVSKVTWDGQVLRFSTFVRSSGRQADYEMQSTSPSEVSLRLSYAEPWVRDSE